MRRRAEPKPASEEADLTRLLAVEARLEGLLVDARAEAGRIEADAAAAVGELERRLEKELEADAAALRNRLDAERDQREAQVRATAEADAARFASISDEQVARVAQGVIARLLVGS